LTKAGTAITMSTPPTTCQIQGTRIICDVAPTIKITQKQSPHHLSRWDVVKLGLLIRVTHCRCEALNR